MHLASRLSFGCLSIALLVLTGCARDLSSDTYTSSAVSGRVLVGTIVSERQVKIKAHDKLGDNAIGGLGGGVAGAAAGSTIGNGRGSTVAGVGGALAGAVVGALIEDALETSDGTEYLVRLDPQYIQPAGYALKQVHESGRHEESLVNEPQTDLVAIAQKTDPALQLGARVYIVYNDDRPRVVAMR